MACCHPLFSSHSLLFLSPPLLPSSSSCSSSQGQPRAFPRVRRPRTAVAASGPSRNHALELEGHAGGDNKREILERYGLDPSSLSLEEPRKLGRRRRQVGRTEKGKHVVVAPQEERKPPRTTHKLLQVVGGTARRKKLLSPKGMDVRPMMEVVRRATFDIIQAAGGCRACLRPGRWLDLFSGTGSVGIEAMSRGCSEAHFVEMDPWVVSHVLKPNLEWTGFLDVSTIHTVRVERFLQQAQQSLGSSGSFDYISITPPYTAVDYGILMEQLGKSPLVGKETFVVVEYPLGTSMSESCGYLVKTTDRRFGRTNLAIYGPTWAQRKRKPKSSLLSLEQ